MIHIKQNRFTSVERLDILFGVFSIQIYVSTIVALIVFSHEYKNSLGILHIVIMIFPYKCKYEDYVMVNITRYW